MMKRIAIYCIFVLVCGVFASYSVENTNGRKLLIDKYEEQLKTTTTARDSVRILYNLFDLSTRSGQVKYGWDIYYTAGRAGDVNSQIDMLLNLGTFLAKNDSIIEEILKLADNIPNPDSRASTKTFISNQHFVRKARRPVKNGIQPLLIDSIMNSHNLEGSNIYDKISLLYQIIQYLGIDSDGTLFNECFDRYGNLMDQLPESDYPLKNQYLTTAAMLNSRINGNPEKAIEYDRQLLRIIDQLQLMYRKKNRTYKNYDPNRFTSYRRMLSNYQALSQEEADEIFDSIQALYSRDPEVRNSMDNKGMPYAYYYMSQHQYDKALPVIKKILTISDDVSAYDKQKFNYMLMEAAQNTGDRNSYISGMEGYIHYSREIDSLRKNAKMKEGLLRDSIMNSPLLYREPTDKPQTQKGQESNDSNIFLILSCFLAAILIAYMVMYIRLRMKKSNQ